MGAGGSTTNRRINKAQMQQIKQTGQNNSSNPMTALQERTLQILYGRFTYLYLLSFRDQAQQLKAA